ncbi:DUF4936 family protein [Massilia sp. PAMC28688]|uniref:DUF4936 family protein n=1 Tax=Massilia sp. PAMC28688 TaxID=2861283 RepID=UPI001C63A3F9|nr:DUF4936 family protein [Massilia sp. PAMC28688]QYF93136.1 DUF4936 family protein [Massilia sp. PAMC28688]
MDDLYIYYRVRDEHAALLAPRVRAMQAALGSGNVKRRPGSADGKQTWMEIYTATGPQFSAMLEQAVAQAGLLELTDGPRHTEIFTDLAPCA